MKDSSPPMTTTCCVKATCNLLRSQLLLMPIPLAAVLVKALRDNYLSLYVATTLPSQTSLFGHLSSQEG